MGCLTRPLLDGTQPFDAECEAAARVQRRLLDTGGLLAPDARLMVLKLLLDYRGQQLAPGPIEQLIAIGHELAAAPKTWRPVRRPMRFAAMRCRPAPRCVTRASCDPCRRWRRGWWNGASPWAWKWTSCAPWCTNAGCNPSPAAAAALALYRAPLLGAEPLRGLLHTARGRLAMVHEALVLAQAQRFLATAAVEQALVTFQQALLQDPLQEPLHRLLMQAHLQRGERAEALRAYRRLQGLLAAHAGPQPAESTQALARASGLLA